MNKINIWTKENEVSSFTTSEARDWVIENLGWLNKNERYYVQESTKMGIKGLEIEKWSQNEVLHTIKDKMGRVTKISMEQNDESEYLIYWRLYRIHNVNHGNEMKEEIFYTKEEVVEFEREFFFSYNDKFGCNIEDEGLYTEDQLFEGTFPYLAEDEN